MDERVRHVEATMALIGNRWRPAIMFLLITSGTHRFSELRRAIPEVSQRMLTLQLRALERAGLVERRFHESVPPKVEYSATELGVSLQPIYEAVCTWSGVHHGEVSDASTRYDAAHPAEG